jgi:hypothetical protein
MGGGLTFARFPFIFWRFVLALPCCLALLPVNVSLVALLPVLPLLALPFSLCPYARPYTFFVSSKRQIKNIFFYSCFIKVLYYLC